MALAMRRARGGCPADSGAFCRLASVRTHHTCSANGGEANRGERERARGGGEPVRARRRRQGLCFGARTLISTNLF